MSVNTKASPRSKSQMISDIVALAIRLGRMPMRTEVDDLASQGKIATSGTYIYHFGKEPKGSGHSWNAVKDKCGVDEKLHEYRKTHGLPDRDQEDFRATPVGSLQEIGQNLQEQTAKRLAELEAMLEAKEQRESAEAACSVYEQVTVPTPFDNGVVGRTEMASQLKLVNLTGYTVHLHRRDLPELPPDGIVKFFYDEYKHYGDVTSSHELSRLFGRIEIRRVVKFYCIIAPNDQQRPFPAPQPGVYYLMSRRCAELIGTTGRTMNDLVFPLEHRAWQDSKILIVDSIGVNSQNPAKF